MSKFKVGDRVVVTIRIPYCSGSSIIDAKGMTGLIVDYDFGYRKFKVMLDGFEDDRLFATFEAHNFLELEQVYNSPLYKALE